MKIRIAAAFLIINLSIDKANAMWSTNGTWIKHNWRTEMKYSLMQVDEVMNDYEKGESSLFRQYLQHLAQTGNEGDKDKSGYEKNEGELREERLEKAFAEVRKKKAE